MNQPDNFFYFYGGGIGGFLLAIFITENLKARLPKINCRIIVPSNNKLYEELAKGYPYINILELNSRAFLPFIKKLLPSITSTNYIATAPSFGKVRLTIKLFGALLSRYSKQSKFIGFQDNSRLNNMLYNKLINTDYGKNIFDTAKELVISFGMNNPTEPNFKFIEDKNILTKYNLLSGNYLFVQPFASNRQRSLPFGRWTKLLRHIAVNFPKYKIVINGDESELAASLEITKPLLPNEQKAVVNLTGKGGLQEKINLIQDAAGFIGVDTGITHIACLLKKPSVVVGNLSNPCWLPYYNPKAEILFSKNQCLCKGNKQGRCVITENGQDYFRCLYFTPQEEIEKAINRLAATKY